MPIDISTLHFHCHQTHTHQDSNANREHVHVCTHIHKHLSHVHSSHSYKINYHVPCSTHFLLPQAQLHVDHDIIIRDSLVTHSETRGMMD